MSEALAQAREMPLFEETVLPEAHGAIDVAEYEHTSIRERFLRSRVGRAAVAGLAAMGLVSMGVAEATPAQADSGLVYTVDPDTAAGGVYARFGPHVGDTTYTPGQGVYPGDQVRLLCGVTDGDPVGPYSNTTWHQVEDLSRPQGVFWLSDRHVQSPNAASQLVPGESRCDENPTGSSAANQFSPELYSSYVEFDRQAAVDWAVNHARDKPPDAGSCTQFVSIALRKGGFPESDTWNFRDTTLRPVRDFDDPLRRGTNATWVTSDFVRYMEALPYVETIDVPTFNAGTNNLPQARIGDIIVYDWEGDSASKGESAIDHAAIVTGFADNNPQYPLVSGWSEDLDRALTYKQRGWTWSIVHNGWLQEEKVDGVQVYKNMRAILFHIRTADELYE